MHRAARGLPGVLRVGENIVLLTCAALVGLAWGLSAGRVAARAVAVELDALFVDVQGLRSALRKLSGGQGRRSRDERQADMVLAKLQAGQSAAPSNGASAPMSKADILARSGFGTRKG